MKSVRIYVDFAATADVLELLRDGTRGHELVFAKTPTSSVLTQGERDRQFASVDVAFGQPDPAGVPDADGLKWIHVSSSSITRYDSPEFRALAAKRGIMVSNSASVYAEACAVHALSFMLAQARQLPAGLQTRTDSAAKAWGELRGSCATLRGETVVIVGYGAIGRRLAELLVPFHMHVFAYRRKARGDEPVRTVSGNDLANLLAEADHVVNILPDSAETRHFFDAARFASLKPGAVFYNIGRGATVNQEALLESLRAGRIKSAWLDVTEPEPLPAGHPLLSQPNCFITPHIAGGHVHEGRTLVRHFLNNLDRFLKGEALVDRVM